MLFSVPASFGQQTTAPDPVLPAQPSPPPQPEHKRILGIIPNYRTAPTPTAKNYRPLTSRQKFKISAQDSFDPGSFLLAGLFAGKSYATIDNPSFGRGATGYARYYGTAYGDIAIGNFMSGAIFPSLLHQDPRYFRRGTGSISSRAGHAISQIFWTRTDSNHHQFNYSEVLGNATAAGIANAYYPDNRTAGATASRFAIQIGLDMAGNLLKEFWPDPDRQVSHKHHGPKP